MKVQFAVCLGIPLHEKFALGKKTLYGQTLLSLGNKNVPE